MSQPEQAPGPAGPKGFPCAHCGAELHFKPGTETLACPYCGARNEIPASEAVVAELDYRTHLARLAEAAPTESCETLKCGACAAVCPPGVIAVRTLRR